MFGDGKTALKFSANRYDQPITLQNVLRLNPLGATSDTRLWTVCAAGQVAGCDLNADLVPQLNELGPSNGFTFGQNNRYDADLQWPNSTEYSVEFQRQLPGNLVASAGYTHRRHAEQHRAEERRRPDRHLHSAHRDRGEQRPAGDGLQPGPGAPREERYPLGRMPRTRYQLQRRDFTINKRMSNHWSVTGGASFGKTSGDIYPTTSAATADLNNPNFHTGAGSSETTCLIRTVPPACTVSPTDFGQCHGAGTTSGFPELTTVSVGNNTVALTQGATIAHG